jgi:hypothetical protein
MVGEILKKNMYQWGLDPGDPVYVFNRLGMNPDLIMGIKDRKTQNELVDLKYRLNHQTYQKEI